MGQVKGLVLSIGQDRVIKRTSKPLIGEWLYDEAKQEGWFTLRKYYSMFNFMGGKMGLVTDKRFALPINPYTNYTKEEIDKLTNLDQRADQALNIAAGQSEKQGHNEIIANGLVACVGGIFLIVIILAILVASGKVGA